MNNILSLMKNKAKENNGWDSYYDKDNDISYRTIKISNHIHSVSEYTKAESIQDTSIIHSIKHIFHLYKIVNFDLNQIDNPLEYSIEVKITQEEYENFFKEIIKVDT